MPYILAFSALMINAALVLPQPAGEFGAVAGTSDAKRMNPPNRSRTDFSARKWVFWWTMIAMMAFVYIWGHVSQRLAFIAGEPPLL